MIWIEPEELLSELKQLIKSTYVLFGDNLFLLQNSQSNILKEISTLYHIENFNFQLNNCFDWNEIFNLCKITPLFSQRTILSLHLSENYLNNLLNKKEILSLYSLIHSNIILILLIYIPNQFPQQNKTWTQFFNKKSVTFVNCIIPNSIRLEKWIKNQSKTMKMIIDNTACQLLCYYYEGNQVLLYQTLQYLYLIYPDGNLSYERVKKIITDSAYFDSNHWIEAILLGNKQRANRILKKLINTNSDLLKLLHKIQYEILIIAQIKYSIAQNTLLYTLFKKYKIHTQYRRILLSKSAQRLNFNQLNKSISLLVKMELKYYENYLSLSKTNFELLSEILCHNNEHYSLNNTIINSIL